jgi:uncharacterized protein YabE (DUF348 family)
MKKTRKLIRKTHKRAKKKAKFLLRHPFLLPVTIFFVVVFFGMGMFITVGATTEGAKDKKIVDLYVDGEGQTVSTRAKTVEDLLARLNIALIDEDIVEPSRETLIIEDGTQINVYRARPVSVVDGSRTITLLSAQRAPRLLADEAGVELLQEDKATLISSEEDLLENTAPEKVVIKRSLPIQINAFGILRQYRTTADTVAQVLEENNVNLREGETVDPADIDTSVTPGMLISINLPGIKTVAISEIVPFSSETIVDSNLEVGKKELRITGQNGERAVIYQVIEENGIELSRNELQTIITKEPVTEVYARGSKPATLSSTINVSGDKVALMAAAGIAPSDYVYVDYIVSKESNWRPGALNSGSGAYGLCQSLPASKMASAGADYLTNPVTQLSWCNGYASRYGGWQGAYNAWLAQGWW